MMVLICTQEAVETKRKGSKNMFKSEKEFLEFMLKYQQVLSERDSGNRKSVKLVFCYLDFFMLL